MRGNFCTTDSIGTIRTFITDSWRLVVTLSRYSICSLNAELAEASLLVALIDTREFFAIISSLTRFIKESSFSISTRTVRFTTGLLDAAFFSCLEDVADAGCVSCTVVVSSNFSAAFSTGSTDTVRSDFAADRFTGADTGTSFSISAFAAGSSLSGSSVPAARPVGACERSSSPPTARSISDTDSAAAITSSSVLSESTNMLKSFSNCSSSISCAEGLDTIISPRLSIALNTRKALAAFRMQLSCT